MKQLSEYPTPITDAATAEHLGSRRTQYDGIVSTCADLERKLAACREFIRDAIDYSHFEELHKEPAESILALTKP